MSGDFCLEYFSIATGEEPKWAAAREMIEQMAKIHISKWASFKDLNADSVEYFFERYEDAGMGYKDEIQPDMNDRTRICEKLIVDLRQVRSAWEEGARDAVTITLRGREYLFTGGMSYGDPPTDIYEWIGRLLSLKILQAAGFESE